MKRALVGIARRTFNVIYHIASSKERQDEVVFLSRQASAPRYDFAQLAEEFERRGWRVTMHLKKVRTRNLPAYVFHVLKELKLLGRCKVAVLDRYDPIVSLLDFECEPQETGVRAKSVNCDFPIKPVVMQLWHAFGAYKKFGFQSVDTAEGHSAEFTSMFSIHRNYSWVVCSGAGARASFAEAFACPQERVIAMDRPQYDTLIEEARLRIDRLEERREHIAQGTVPYRVLFAPTLRISGESMHPIRDLYADRGKFADDVAVLVSCSESPNAKVELLWSFHPLEAGLDAPSNVSGQLLECDCVVTDYSSIVYEAYLLGIPVLFYVPDLNEYRFSPGLNTDPGELSPILCSVSRDELAHNLSRIIAEPERYPAEALDAFAASAFDIDVPREGAAASRLADFILDAVSRRG